MSKRWVVATATWLVAVLAVGAAHGAARGRCEQIAKPPPPKCANFDCSDPMFKTYPPRSTYVSSHCVELATPFAIYDGRAALLMGRASLAELRAITKGSGYEPVVTDDGHGIAAMAVHDLADTNAGPYREVFIGFVVNERRMTVSTGNPYSYLAETFNPQHNFWMHKLILSEQMPIDWGREVAGYDKNPVPQRIEIRSATDDTTFAAADPVDNAIVAGRVWVDSDPTAQAQALRQVALAGSEWLQPVLRKGGLAQINFVNPDVLGRSDEILRSFALVRLKSEPSLGLFGAESTLRPDPGSDFGAALVRLDFRPVVNARVADRIVVDLGFADERR